MCTKKIVFALAYSFLSLACSSSGGFGGADDGGGNLRVDGGARADGGTRLDGGSRGDGGAVLEDGGATEADGGSVDGGAEVGGSCSTSACHGDQILVCGINGFYGPGEDCSVRNLRCVNGDCAGCQPGARRCAGTTAVEACNEDGLTYSTVETCAQNQACDQGRCVTAGPCGVGGKLSNQGCDYWAVDLPNADVSVSAGAPSPANAQYAVVISNTDETRSATVVITKSDGASPVSVVTDTVPPRDLKVFNLPARNADQCGTTMGCASVGYKAYRIQTSIPVVAYQFNPLNNTTEAFSNDASLLLPSNALDTEYIAVTGDAQGGQNRSGQSTPWGAFVAVVGTADTATTVTVTIPAGISFVTSISGATVSGQVVTASVAKYQVLTVLSTPPASETATPSAQVQGGGNLSGARVSASAKVAVFAGNIASVVPHGPGSKCCADHMEEQMFPVSTWGKDYVAMRSLPRQLGATSEYDYWRLTAALDGTTLTYVTNGTSGLIGQPTTLRGGQSVEFRSRGDFIVSANNPIMLAQFMTSSNQAFDLGPGGINQRTCTPNTANPAAADLQCTQAYQALSRCITDPVFGGGYCQPVGDPSLTLIPPVRQFRRDYVFLTPLDYHTDYAVIVAPVGTTVTLDGTVLTAASFQTVGALAGVTYIRARVVLTTRGRHVLTATAPVGLIVGGYDRDVSYGYPGGLNLESSAASDGGL